jgi:hypothetical protein
VTEDLARGPRGPSDRPAGYSGTPLPQKLGIKPGVLARIVNAPSGYADTLGALPDGCLTRYEEWTDLAGERPTGEPSHFFQIFVTTRAELEAHMPALERRLASDGMLWVSWPKRASGRPTDLTEDTVRAVALDTGLVDVKVCAVDGVWSGLKLVRRLKDRPVASR